MAVNVHIERNGNENNLSILRRFRNRIKTSGVINKSKQERFHDRPESKFKQKKSKLRSLEKQEKRKRLYKLGKIDG